MFKKMLEESPLIICLLSICLFLLFLVRFDQDIAVPRIQNEQITSYSSGEKIAHIHVRYFGKTANGEPLIKDDYGSRLLIDGDADYPKYTPMILTGRVGKNREFILEEMQVFPNIKVKIIVSVMAVLLMIIMLIPAIRITSKGLELKVKD